VTLAKPPSEVRFQTTTGDGSQGFSGPAQCLTLAPTSTFRCEPQITKHVLRLTHCIHLSLELTDSID